MTTLEQYFSCLANEKGVQSFVILKDDAINTTFTTITGNIPDPPRRSSSSSSLRISPYQNTRKQPRTPQEKFLSNEPICNQPSRPIRKSSDEDLFRLKKQEPISSSPPSAFKNQSPILLAGTTRRKIPTTRVSKKLLHHLYTDIKVPPRHHVRTNPSAA